MKTINVYSHIKKPQNCIRAESGDYYDSALEVLDEYGEVIYKSDNVNVDDSVRTIHILEIVDGTYGFIMGMHRRKYPGGFLYNLKYDKYIKKWTDFSRYWKARILPCMFPNPVHNGKKEGHGINLHKGGDNYDWSALCLTIHWRDYPEFEKLFKINEKAILNKQTDPDFSWDDLDNFEG